MLGIGGKRLAGGSTLETAVAIAIAALPKAGEGWTFGGFDFSSGHFYVAVTFPAFPRRVDAFSGGISR